MMNPLRRGLSLIALASAGMAAGACDPGSSAMAGRLELVASALVPRVGGAGGQALTAGTEESWSGYLGENGPLSEVFGPEGGPVTRVRNSLRLVRGGVEAVLLRDGGFTCQGGAALTGDTMELAFLGAVDNAAGDIGCSFEDASGEAPGTTLYGQSGDEVVTIAQMIDSGERDNTEDTARRGNHSRLVSVAYTHYAEATTDDGVTAYLDLQYAHATIYSGVDDDLATGADNVLFKSRSRIVGRVSLDAGGAVSASSGDFQVTKYDAGNNDDGSHWTQLVRATGRGGYASGGTALLNFDRGAPDEDTPETFCISPAADGGDPNLTDGCDEYTTAIPWTDGMPFEVAPAIQPTFDDNPFFGEGDLIADDAANFAIPG